MQKNLIRQNLINSRKAEDYTQKEISEKLGITPRHYQELEAGTSDGSIRIWKKLKIILKAPSIDYLLEQEADIEKPECSQAV